MSNILNKSNHPIEVKKIPVRLWRLRDEIEAAIASRIYQEGHSDDQPVFIDDIKQYYINALNGDLKKEDEDNDSPSEPAGEDSNLDSSGNPMDDDALAMAAALSGGGEDEDKKDGEEADSKEEDSEAKEGEEADAKEEDDDDAKEEDDEASALAAQMLADQGLGPEPTETEDSESEALAAQMLADQGLGPQSTEAEDSESEALAAQMLADQGISTQDEEVKEKKREPFTRVIPQGDKLIDGFVFLSDIQMDQIMIFSRDTFIHGQSIILEFLIPNSFSQMIEVKASVNIGRNSKIISPTKPDYRIQGQFQFKFPGERDTLRSFLQTIEPDIPDPPKKLKRPESDEDDDDFDDLGF